MLTVNTEIVINEVRDEILSRGLNPDNIWMETFLGHKFYPLAPREEDIHLEDIAHSLSMQCRFGGHCSVFWTVATHSLNVLHQAQEIAKQYRAKHGELPITPVEYESTDFIVGALLHDASECYLQDIRIDLKCILGNRYKVLENYIQSIIYGKWMIELDDTERYLIKVADRQVLMAEAQILMQSTGAGWGVELDLAEEGYSIPDPTSLPYEIKEYSPSSIKKIFLEELEKHI